MAFCIRTELELSRPDPGDIIPWLCTLEFIIIPVTQKIVIQTICVSLVTQILDGWMTCDFTSFSTVFQSYQVNGRLIMKGCVHWSSV